MRFVFVDRILALEPGRSIEVLKNVTATEDVFTDHFPGYPVLPGALVVEVFEQACQLLIVTTHAFDRVARLERLARASFRHFVRPGDQLRATCRRRDGGADRAGDRWTMLASAQVDGRVVATATLELVLEAVAGDGARERVARLRELSRVAQPGPVDPQAALARS